MKTLKDFEFDIIRFVLGSEIRQESGIVRAKQLRQEAIKWCKALEKDGGLKGYNANLIGKEFKKPWDKKFAQRDGFDHFNDLVVWLHKRYDLSEPKRFEVIRWN